MFIPSCFPVELVSPRQHAGLVQDVDDFAGQTLELVVEVVCEVVDTLVRTLDAGADFGQVLGMLDTDLVELAANLAQEFFQLLLERRPALEVIEDLEEDEQDRAKRGGIDEPRGEPRCVRHRHFLREEIVGRKKEEGGNHGVVRSS